MRVAFLEHHWLYITASDACNNSKYTQLDVAVEERG